MRITRLYEVITVHNICQKRLLQSDFHLCSKRIIYDDGSTDHRVHDILNSKQVADNFNPKPQKCRL